MALSTISGTTGITDATITSVKLADFAAAVDLNGVELILDADQDTSITADTDDRIDLKIGGAEHISFNNSSGDTVIKPMADGKDIVFQQYDGNKILEINDGNYVAISGAAAGPGELRFYEDTDNGTHYTGFKAGNATASLSYVLPLADGTDGYQLTTDGSGTLSWAAAGTTLSGSTNNTVVTVTGANALAGEGNLTFDGSTLAVTGAATISTTLAVTGIATFTGVPVLPANTIDSAHYVDGSIDTAHIANDQITAALMADNSIDSDMYVDGSIDNAHLADDAVDSDEIAAGAIDLAHMSVNSIDSDQYVDGSIDLVHMSVNSIDSDQYVDGSIDLVHMSANSVDSDQYVDGSIDLVHMSANSVDSDQYVDGSIDTAHIANDQITAALMADNSIDSDMYVDGSIDTAHIADDAVTADKLANAINTSIAAKLPLAGGTMTGDITPDDNHIVFSDNGELKVGNSADLRIYHDGTNSYIRNKTGALKIATETSGIALTIGHTTSEVTFGDNVTVTDTISANSSLIRGAVVQVQAVHLTPSGAITSAGGVSELSTSLRIAFTPKHASSKLKHEFFAPYNMPNSSHLQWAYFYDVTAGAIALGSASAGSRQSTHWGARTSDTDANDFDNMSMMIYQTAGSTTARTYTIWHGTESATASFGVSPLSSGSGATWPLVYTITEIYNP